MRIALVDDDRAQIETLSKMVTAELSKSGYPVSKLDAFESGEAFLAKWQAGAYDIIILDIFMDKLTGVETARKIRESDHMVRLVFCTISNEFASESYEVAAQYYLHKPVGQEGISEPGRSGKNKSRDAARRSSCSDSPHSLYGLLQSCGNAFHKR